MSLEKPKELLNSLSIPSSDLTVVKNAIISVFDKKDLNDIGLFLYKMGIKIYSTGSTFKKLQESGIPSSHLEEISQYTGFEEMLDGRVKTLHPKIHGGILYARGRDQHEKEIQKENIVPFDLVIINLYPFEKAISQNSDFPTAIENIDIGGPCMLRAAAKNNFSVTAISSPDQYSLLKEVLNENNGNTTQYFRKKMAYFAFKRVSEYDNNIKSYFESTLDLNEIEQETKHERVYYTKHTLKYGCNPHQSPAALATINSNSELPFQILNGTPGYINSLDAILAFQLVTELTSITGLPAAASFKHCSPAGAALSRELTEIERKIYEIPEEYLSETATAYILARNADPKCSFGDFISVSGEVDISFASYLKREVSDGIIANSYTEEALEILKKKKNGNFIILKGNKNFVPPELEFREVFGMAFIQKRNNAQFNANIFKNIVTKEKTITDNALLDLILASVTIKYTQSNSVCFAKNKQVIGVGAGQQSRIDCLKLAGRKALIWYLRYHSKVINLKFKPTIKRQDRINMRVGFIESDFTPLEYFNFSSTLTEIPEPLSEKEKQEFCKMLQEVSVSSDGFFPFRDNIDQASKFGVKYIAHPGGSVQDENIIEAANEYKMVLINTGLRAFLH